MEPTESGLAPGTIAWIAAGGAALGVAVSILLLLRGAEPRELASRVLVLLVVFAGFLWPLLVLVPHARRGVAPAAALLLPFVAVVQAVGVTTYYLRHAPLPNYDLAGLQRELLVGWAILPLLLVTPPFVAMLLAPPFGGRRAVRAAAALAAVGLGVFLALGVLQPLLALRASPGLGDAELSLMFGLWSSAGAAVALGVALFTLWRRRGAPRAPATPG